MAADAAVAAAPEVLRPLFGDLHLRYHQLATLGEGHPVVGRRRRRRRDVADVVGGGERALERLGQPGAGAPWLPGWRDRAVGARS